MSEDVRPDQRIREEAHEAVWDKYGSVMDMLLHLKATLEVSVNAIEEAEYLRLDRDYWKQQYFDSQNHAIKHAEAMNGLMLKAAINGAFDPKEKP